MPVKRDETGTTITGDAVLGYRALAAKHALKLWLDHGIFAVRGLTVAMLVASASEFTHVDYLSYKVSKRKLAQAAYTDLSDLFTVHESLDVVGSLRTEG